MSHPTSDDNGRYRILVAYATGFGTTAEVAQVIGEELSQRGALVDVKAMADVHSITNYDAVVLGGAIRYDTWLRSAKRFLARHHAALSAVPVAYFFTCLTLAVHRERARRRAVVYANKLRALQRDIEPVDVAGFAGVLDYHRMTFAWRLLAHLVFAIFRVQPGDYRDWQAIRQWARDIDTSMRKGPVTARQ